MGTTLWHIHVAALCGDGKLAAVLVAGTEGGVELQLVAVVVARRDMHADGRGVDILRQVELDVIAVLAVAGLKCEIATFNMFESSAKLVISLSTVEIIILSFSRP